MSKLISWVKLRTNIYYYSEEIWSLFSNDYLKENFYIFNIQNRIGYEFVPEKLDEYKMIYIYDLRLINREFDISLLIKEVLDNLKKSGIGMAFIPDENLLDEIWYHNLLYVLDRNALVIWKDLEETYAHYIINNPERFAFTKFCIFQFERMQKRTVRKGRYMLFDTKFVFEKKRSLIVNAKYIKIYILRCDRIGEEIRVLNKLLFEEDEKDIFKLYITVDAYSRPFEGTNTCFNELVARQLNLLKNKDEYALWIQDIFQRSEKYEFDGRGIELRHLNSGVRELYQPVIDFSDDELEIGRQLIRDKLGIKEKYVCLFTRDPKYLMEILPNIDCSYHNYRDTSFDVMNKAIDYFENCNIQTIRMGQITEQKEIHSNCIDFVKQGYDEYLDLLIFRYSKFSICSGSGILEIPNIFGRPVLFLLYYYPQLGQFNDFYVKEDLCIFNRIRNLDEKRELSLLEIFEVSYQLVYSGNCRGEYFEQHGLELIPFSQDDILDAAVEMNEKLDGTWQDKNEYRELNNKFNLKLKVFFNQYNINTSLIPIIPVSVKYLRKYKYLLED